MQHYNSSPENAKNWRSYSLNSSHGFPSSDNSQLSAGSGRGQLSVHLSGQSVEDQQMSGDSVGSGKQDSSILRNTSSSSFSHGKTAPPSSSAGGRRAIRGYQSKRALLHQSRSKTAISEQEASELVQSWGETETAPADGVRGEVRGRMETGILHTSPPAPPVPLVPPVTIVRSPTPLQYVTVPSSGTKVSSTMPIMRYNSVKEKTKQSSPLQPERERPRPLSAFEPHSVDAPTLGIPGSTHIPHLRSTDSVGTIGIGRETPLYTTTLSPSGEEGVFREVNIEEAIARSQGTVLSNQDHNSTLGLGLGRNLPPRTRRIVRHKIKQFCALLK